MDLIQLLWSFAKVGIFGFGGGPSMIPLIQEEVVELRGWLTQEEFLDAFAFGSTLPGPIATKMAAYVGYKTAGGWGAAAGLIGIALPTALMMIGLLAVYLRFRHVPQVEGFLRGVRPVVVALLLVVAFQFAPRALGNPSALTQNWPLWLLAASAFVLAIQFNVHPALLIVAGGVLGILVLS